MGRRVTSDHACVSQHPHPHSSTQETPNFLMLGRETRVPDHLTYHVPLPEGPVHEYVRELVNMMQTAHEVLREKQWQVRGVDSDEPPLYQTGYWVWMLSKPEEARTVG